MILEVNTDALITIKQRETKQRDSIPKHTLDWYTYSNRVELIEEIEKHFSEVVITATSTNEENDTQATETFFGNPPLDNLSSGEENPTLNA